MQQKLYPTIGISMKSSLLILSLLLIPLCNILGQEIIFTSNFDFIGYHQDQPVFGLYSRNGDIEVIRNGIYSRQKNEFGMLGFKFEREIKNLKGDLFFVHDSISVTHEYDTSKSGRWIRIYSGSHLLDSMLSEFEFWHTYNIKNNRFFLTVSTRDYSRIAQINLNSKTPYLQLIPLYGRQIYTYTDHLYFSYDRRNYGYSPYLDDIFRVRIDDCNNRS